MDYVRAVMRMDNTIYTVVDYVGGLTDIKNKCIRAIGDPMERFAEDALRMLRACRFAAQLNFAVDARTMLAINKLAPTIKKVSAERISAELLKIVSSSHPNNGLVPMVLTGLLNYLPISPIKENIADVARRFNVFKTTEPALGMAMLLTGLPANGNAVCLPARHHHEALERFP